MFVVVIVAIICVGFSVGIISCEKVLVVKDLDEHATTKFILSDEGFTLGYIHSVLLTPAEEMFTVDDDNQLLLQKTVYESFGVGLPYSQEKFEFEIKDGKFILYVKRKFPSLKMRISPIPKHWLSIGSQRYELIDIVEKPEDLIDIYARNSFVIKIKNFELIF